MRLSPLVILALCCAASADAFSAVPAVSAARQSLSLRAWNSVDGDEMPTSLVKREENLRDGWRAEIANNNKVYYHNYVSGESTWDKPIKPFLNLDRGMPILARKEKQETGIVDARSALQPAAMDISWIDTNRLVVEFEKEGLMEGDPAVDKFSTPGGIRPSRKFLLSDLTSCGVKREENLMDGWRAEVEYNSKRTYYYNHITGEAVWEKPLKTSVHLYSDEPMLAMKEVEETGYIDKLSLQPMPMGFSWIDVQRFFVILGKDIENQGVVTTDVFSTPGGIYPSRTFNLDVKTSCCVKIDNDLMDGWRAEVDYGSKQTYYHNYVTGETTWEKPLRFVSASANPIFSKQEDQQTGYIDPKSLQPVPITFSWIDVNRLETMVAGGPVLNTQTDGAAAVGASPNGKGILNKAVQAAKELGSKAATGELAVAATEPN